MSLNEEFFSGFFSVKERERKREREREILLYADDTCLIADGLAS